MARIGAHTSIGQSTSGNEDACCLKVARTPAGVSDWATEAVAWGLKCGVISGTKGADGTRYVSPQMPVTRATMAAILINSIDNDLLA